MPRRLLAVRQFRIQSALHCWTNWAQASPHNEDKGARCLLLHLRLLSLTSGHDHYSSFGRMSGNSGRSIAIPQTDGDGRPLVYVSRSTNELVRGELSRTHLQETEASAR